VTARFCIVIGTVNIPLTKLSKMVGLVVGGGDGSGRQGLSDQLPLLWPASQSRRGRFDELAIEK
jgi:hypothetical protein